MTAHEIMTQSVVWGGVGGASFSVFIFLLKVIWEIIKIKLKNKEQKGNNGNARK